MTKQEAFDFIRYLRERPHIIMEPQVRRFRTGLCSQCYVESLYPIQVRTAHIISRAPTALYAYRAIAHETAKHKFPRRVSAIFRFIRFTNR